MKFLNFLQLLKHMLRLFLIGGGGGGGIQYLQVSPHNLSDLNCLGLKNISVFRVLKSHWQVKDSYMSRQIFCS